MFQGQGDFDKLSVERQIEKLRVAEIKTREGNVCMGMVDLMIERENLRVYDFNAYDEHVSLIIDVVEIVKKYNT